MLQRRPAGVGQDMRANMTNEGEAASGDTEATEGRVLIVDDEPMMGTTLRMALSEAHQVVIVESGHAAKELLARDPGFDAIVCDLMMPDLSGMDLHAWLVTEAPELARRMVFMTGGAYTDGARRFLGGVSNPSIQKPFDVEELLTLVDTVRKQCG